MQDIAPLRSPNLPPCPLKNSRPLRNSKGTTKWLQALLIREVGRMNVDDIERSMSQLLDGKYVTPSSVVEKYKQHWLSLTARHNLNASSPLQKLDLKYKHCIWIQNASTKIMHLFCKYLPQRFTSTDQSENYDWNDSVAYGETFTEIIEKSLKNFGVSEFLNTNETLLLHSQTWVPCKTIECEIKR